MILYTICLLIQSFFVFYVVNKAMKGDNTYTINFNKIKALWKKQ